MAITVSRRPEGFQRPHQNQKHAQQASQHQQQQQHRAARMKRPLDPIDNLSDPLKAKRTRIAVEIYARPLAQVLSPSKKPVLLKRQLSATQPVQVASSHNPEKPSPPTATNPLPLPATVPATPPAVPAAAVPAPTTARPLQSRPQPPTITPTITPTTTTAPSKQHGLTRNQEKVINGIRHELDRLQPSAADTSSATGPPGRKLRSQEATRFKSELAAYFPEYDEVIGNDPKEQHLLNADTPIIILDTEHESSDTVANSTAAAHQHPTRSKCRPHSSTVRVYSDRLFTDLHTSPLVGSDFLKAEHSSDGLEDPLPDSHFAPSHRRAERLEKSIRNTERGRAQHEKDQIIRLLGELQGHDWLRTMGVNGVTESRRKSFEPARDHFIKGCQTILDKFRSWSQEEKRRKLEKERALAEETDEEEDEDQQEDDIDDSDCSDGSGSKDDVDMVDVENDSGDDVASEDEPPECSDVDAAARQLHDEAMERARYAASASPRRTRAEPPLTILDSVPREFTSFFEKRHQRDAALNQGRRRGRTVLAWGHPVPEMSEYNFELPEFFLDEDTLKAHERQKRRDRRQRKQ
ncbi:something about silencing, SAS, complex subunit 4-domain-containing protein [Xylaria flabelliformis]|nr:something about silencing, SAS, complex subunit 4-domain-containing protein [Xylaria flabelliformis]